jgi:hypothetical protein
MVGRATLLTDATTIRHPEFSADAGGILLAIAICGYRRNEAMERQDRLSGKRRGGATSGDRFSLFLAHVKHEPTDFCTKFWRVW